GADPGQTPPLPELLVDGARDGPLALTDAHHAGMGSVPLGFTRGHEAPPRAPEPLLQPLADPVGEILAGRVAGAELEDGDAVGLPLFQGAQAAEDPRQGLAFRIVDSQRVVQDRLGLAGAQRAGALEDALPLVRAPGEPPSGHAQRGNQDGPPDPPRPATGARTRGGSTGGRLLPGAGRVRVMDGCGH